MIMYDEWVDRSIASCLGPLIPRGAVEAHHDGLLHESLHSCRLCATACVSAKDLPIHSNFGCLRLFHEVSLWLGRLILSRALTISGFVAL